MASIVINIGNTNIRFGLFRDNECQLSWTLTTKPYKTRDELFAQIMALYQSYEIPVAEINQLIIGSVVPALTQIMRSAVEKIHPLQALIVDRTSPTGVTHCSKQMGTDIYANLVGAHYLYPNSTKIVVDFGTALTLSCVDEKGKSLGVAIAPGVITSLKSLIAETAQLSEIELRKPDSVLAFNTEACMQSGLVFGFLGMIEGFIDRINSELNTQCFVIATGGISHVYQDLTTKINVTDKLHTLKGLYHIAND